MNRNKIANLLGIINERIVKSEDYADISITNKDLRYLLTILLEEEK